MHALDGSTAPAVGKAALVASAQIRVGVRAFDTLRADATTTTQARALPLSDRLAASCYDGDLVK